MSRYNSNGSHFHKCSRMGHDWYRLSWSVSRYVKGSRLRFERHCTRDTDETGARRFCKKWNVVFPEVAKHE